MQDLKALKAKKWEELENRETEAGQCFHCLGRLYREPGSKYYEGPIWGYNYKFFCNKRCKRQHKREYYWAKRKPLWGVPGSRPLPKPPLTKRCGCCDNPDWEWWFDMYQKNKALWDLWWERRRLGHREDPDDGWVPMKDYVPEAGTTGIIDC